MHPISLRESSAGFLPPGSTYLRPKGGLSFPTKVSFPDRNIGFGNPDFDNLPEMIILTSSSKDGVLVTSHVVS